MKNTLKTLLIDLLNNAYRRIKEGKYDDAVARLYRSFELLGQIRLFELGLTEQKRLENEKIFALLIDKLKTRLDEKTLKKYVSHQKEEDINKGIIKLGLEKSYELLHDLNDDKLGFVFEELSSKKEISNLLAKRNQSILAHGLKPIDKDAAERMFMIIKEYCKNVINDLENKMKNGAFPILSI